MDDFLLDATFHHVLAHEPLLGWVWVRVRADIPDALVGLRGFPSSRLYEPVSTLEFNRRVPPAPLQRDVMLARVEVGDGQLVLALHPPAHCARRWCRRAVAGLDPSSGCLTAVCSRHGAVWSFADAAGVCGTEVHPLSKNAHVSHLLAATGSSAFAATFALMTVSGLFSTATALAAALVAFPSAWWITRLFRDGTGPVASSLFGFLSSLSFATVVAVCAAMSGL